MKLEIRVASASSAPLLAWSFHTTILGDFPTSCAFGTIGIVLHIINTKMPVHFATPRRLIFCSIGRKFTHENSEVHIGEPNKPWGGQISSGLIFRIYFGIAVIFFQTCPRSMWVRMRLPPPRRASFIDSSAFLNRESTVSPSIHWAIPMLSESEPS